MTGQGVEGQGCEVGVRGELGVGRKAGATPLQLHPLQILPQLLAILSFILRGLGRGDAWYLLKGSSYRG